MRANKTSWAGTSHTFITFWYRDESKCWAVIRLTREMDNSCPPYLQQKIKFFLSPVSWRSPGWTLSKGGRGGRGWQGGPLLINAKGSHTPGTTYLWPSVIRPHCWRRLKWWLMVIVPSVMKRGSGMMSRIMVPPRSCLSVLGIYLQWAHRPWMNWSQTPHFPPFRVI